MGWVLLVLFGMGVLLVATTLYGAVKIVPTKKAYIVERLGKYSQTLQPGLHFLIPWIDRVAYIQDLKEDGISVPPQECFTRDNVRVEVDGVLYLSVVSPENASYGVTNYRFAAVQLAQTTTRSVIGILDLDRTFEERDVISAKVVEALAEVSEAWGIQVHRYEVSNLVPPNTVRNAMERQLTAERDRRAMLATAEGEAQSLVNNSEAQMQEAIQISEGEKQRRVNEAQGLAEEILSLAQATADSIRTVGAALTRPGGVEATNLRLRRRYLAELGKASAKSTVLLPADLSDMEQVVGRVSLHAEPGAIPPDQGSTAAALPARVAAPIGDPRRRPSSAVKR